MWSVVVTNVVCVVVWTCVEVMVEMGAELKERQHTSRSVIDREIMAARLTHLVAVLWERARQLQNK